MNETTLEEAESSLLKKIVELGFLTEYESKAYIKLLEEGRVNARTLSLKAGIPRSKVYYVMKRLQEMGLIISIGGSKREFIPRDPLMTLEEVRILFKQAHDRAETFEEIFKTLRIKYEEREDRSKTILLLLIEGIKNINNQIKEMILKAKNNLLIIADEYHFNRIYPEIQKELVKIDRRQIKLKFIIEKVAEKSLYINELEYIYPITEVVYRLPALVVFVDKSKTLLGKIEYDSIYGDESAAIYFNNPVLTKLLQEIIFPQLKTES